MSIHTYLILYLKFIAFSQSAKILGLTPFPLRSNTMPFDPIWRKLLERGHQVVLITANPIEDKHLDNLNQIDVSEVYEKKIRANFYENVTGDPAGKHNEIFRVVVQLPEVRDLLLDKSQQFDLAMVDYASPIWTVFGYHYKCPMIGLLAHDLYRIHNIFGNPTNPAIHTDNSLGINWNFGFSGKMTNVYYGLVILLNEMFFMYKDVNLYIEQHFMEPVPVEKSMIGVKMVFVNAIKGFHKVRPVYDNTVYIGGGSKYCGSKSSNAKELLSLRNVRNGVLVNIDVEQTMMNNMIESTSNLPYTFIWMNCNCTKHGKHGLFLNDHTDAQIFENANVKLYISNGVTPSIEVALYFKVPLLLLPNNAEEMHNAQKVEIENIGKFILKSEYNSYDFKTDIINLIENKTYLTNIKELADELQEPMSGFDSAIEWSELLIKQNKLRLLENPARNLNFFESFFLDIVFGNILLIILILYLLKKINDLFTNAVNASAQRKEKTF